MNRFFLGIIKKMKYLPPPLYVKYYYAYYTGKKLDLKNPVKFNEKIQWMKVYYQPDILTKLVDKYHVRDYVKKKIGSKYLNELIAVYDHAKEVKFDALPKQFVLKGTHGCHFNLIVPDKAQLNKLKARFLMHKWMRKNQYYRGGLEWAYKNVKPRIIAEAFLKEKGKTGLNDYKFFCFNGEPLFVQVDVEIEANIHRRFYDMQWNPLPFAKSQKVPSLKEDIQMPLAFEEMKAIARKLADKFPFVRVDLYAIREKIIFGELTFYPSDGRSEFIPEKYNRIWGHKIKLPAIPEGQKVIKEI